MRKRVSSGAIRPARAPASMDMLHTVMRPSIDRPRIASPSYSMTYPAPPAVPTRPITLRITSFAATPAGGSPPHGDPHVLRAPLEQRLRRQDVLYLAGADAEGERPERPVRRGVAVAANDGGAGKGEPLFGADDVDDALAQIGDGEIGDAEFGAIFSPASRPGGARDRRRSRRRGRRRRWGCCGRRRQAWLAGGAPCGPPDATPRKPGAGDFMHQVAVDIDQRGAVVLFIDDMLAPESCRTGSALRASLKPFRRFRRPRRGRGLGRRAFRRCAPPCRCVRAGNRAWPGAQRRGASPRYARPAAK